MTKDKLEEKHICDNVNCNHNNTEGLCLMFNPDVCKYRQLQKEYTELEKACDETQELLDKQIEATLKLDKENAELTEKLEQDCESSWHEGFNCSEKERLKQLTEAKKIIRELSKYVSDSKWYVQNGYVELQKELVAKAEVFINKE